jgi:hypothetical protein
MENFVYQPLNVNVTYSFPIMAGKIKERKVCGFHPRYLENNSELFSFQICV